jgi:hypothetical protein
MLEWCTQRADQAFGGTEGSEPNCTLSASYDKNWRKGRGTRHRIN